VSRSRRRRAAPGGGVSLRSTVSSSPSLRRAYYSWHSRAGVISRLPLLDDALSLSLSLPPSLSLSLSLCLRCAWVFLYSPGEERGSPSDAPWRTSPSVHSVLRYTRHGVFQFLHMLRCARRFLLSLFRNARLVDLLEYRLLIFVSKGLEDC